MAHTHSLSIVSSVVLVSHKAPFAWGLQCVMDNYSPQSWNNRPRWLALLLAGLRVWGLGELDILPGSVGPSRRASPAGMRSQRTWMRSRRTWPTTTCPTPSLWTRPRPLTLQSATWSGCRCLVRLQS